MNTRKKKISVLRIARAAVQIASFLFLPSLYIGALDGVRQIYLAVIHQSISADLLPQLIEIIAVLPVTILLGRFFCGWMCAFGSFTDLIYSVSHKVFRKRLKISEQADAWMKKIKYVILVFLAVAVWSLNVTAFNSASPWDVFGMLAVIGKAPDFSYVIMNLTAGFIILILIIVASAFVERFFCRYLCPMGAVFALSSKLRIAKIKKPSAQCGSCRACTNSCAMGIPLYRMEAVGSGECINCMKCIASCPRGNTSFTVAKNAVRPLMAGAATVAVMTGIYCTGDFTANTAGTGVSTAISAGLTDGSGAANRLYKDGTYEGTGSGFRGTTTVSVTVKNDKITDITTVSYNDDERFYGRACPTVVQEILDSQSTEVDAVSGATFSSNGIMQAVEDALNQAKTVEFSQSTADSSANETSPSGDSASQAGNSEQSAEANSGQYKDGTYQGSGTGFRGAVTTVSVTVSGGQISTVKVDSYGDDDRFFNRAYPVISQEILGSQSAEVDAVSGATYSSNGIMQAVADALNQANA